MKNFIFTLLLLFPIFPSALYAQSTMVESSGVYTGPLQTNPTPVVVELFSSQNCPACPPADELLGNLAKSKGVIALSCHVAYFGPTSEDLGRPICTQRQTRYIEQMGRKSHFTPQMVINGHISEIGYKTAEVSAAIIKGRSETLKNISIKSKAKSVYSFDLPPMPVNGAVEIWVGVYQKPKQVSERGKKVTYSNVMKRYMSLGVWHGDALEKVVSPALDSQSAGFAVIAQEVKSGKIIAAGDFKI